MNFEEMLRNDLDNVFFAPGAFGTKQAVHREKDYGPERTITVILDANQSYGETDGSPTRGYAAQCTDTVAAGINRDDTLTIENAVYRVLGKAPTHTGTTTIILGREE
jgi:hypothetical protein